MGPRLKTCCQLVGREHGSNRNTTSESFGKRHDVRRHAKMLIRKEFSSSAYSCLDLIEDKDYAVFVTELSYILKIVRVRNPHPSFTLNRFQKHGAGIFCYSGLQCVYIIIRNMPEPGDKGFKAPLQFLLSRGRKCGVGPAMEGIYGRHYFEPVLPEHYFKISPGKLN